MSIIPLFAALAVLLSTTVISSVARAQNCADVVKEHLAWITGNPHPFTEERFVQFVLVSNQAWPAQVVTYQQGRLDRLFDSLYGTAQVYLNPIYFSQPLPSDPNAKIFTNGKVSPEPKVVINTQGELHAEKTMVVETQCRDGVIYGWEKTPPGEDEATYPKTFFAVSLRKMSQPKPLSVKFPGQVIVPQLQQHER